MLTRLSPEIKGPRASFLVLFCSTLSTVKSINLIVGEESQGRGCGSRGLAGQGRLGACPAPAAARSPAAQGWQGRPPGRGLT